MPPRGRPGGKGRPPSSASTGSHIIVIGNCRLDVPDVLGYELTHEGFSTEIQDIGTLKVYEAVTRVITPPVGLSFTLLNPKSVHRVGKLLLQDVLHLYNVELPAMNFAANTGKESPFLESCIMDGKYCTLIMRKNDPESCNNELVGAVTFQILPPDTQQAEIPLAAVRHAHQRKGYGTLMYKELQRRLMDVGVTSVYCWGDVESQRFWSNRGFVKVAEVDGRGKPKKLPIKGDLKKAMSIPGSATLMISYLDWGVFPTAVSVLPENSLRKETYFQQIGKGFPDSPPLLQNSGNGFDANSVSSPMNMVTTPQLAGEVKSTLANSPPQTVRKSPQLSTVQKCTSSITPLNMEGTLFSVISEVSDMYNSPGTVTEPFDPNKNPLAIILSVPDSEPLDGNYISAHVPVIDITNTVPSTKGPGPQKRRTYARRQQIIASSTSVNLVSTSILPSCSGKENIGEFNLRGVLEVADPNEKGKLSAFLGPRTKSSHRKASAVTGSGVPSRQLDPIPEKDDQSKLSSLSAFIGPRRKPSLRPECEPQVALHGEALADSVDKIVAPETGGEAETLNKSLGTGPKKRGRPVKDNVHELDAKILEETVKDDDFCLPRAASGLGAGVKRSIPPKARTGKVQKKVHGATGSDVLALPRPGASQQKGKRPIKRGQRSIAASKGARERGQKASSAQIVSVLNTASVERDNAVDTNPKNLDDEAGPPKGRSPFPTSLDSVPKTGRKRGRPAQLVGIGTKRRKVDTTNSVVLDNNQSCSKGDGAKSVQNFQQKDAEHGLAEMANMLLAEHKVAGADSCAQESSKVMEGTSHYQDTHLQSPVQVSNSTSPETDHTPLDESHTDAVQVSEPATTGGAGSKQQGEKPKYVIMFMNMADENKKRQLSKHVEKLGGLVTCEGSKCTHVVTMEVRRTLNFCVAVSSGAWILSPDWLKSSVKHKTFVGEEPFILRDKKFEAKYSISLKDVIPKAQQMPNLLLDGLYIYPTPHIHPPVNTITEIMKAAGGHVLATFEEAVQLEKKSLGIIVACEEDMELAMAAAKAGLRTYNSDWLLTSIVKQELDFSVPQFTESL